MPQSLLKTPPDAGQALQVNGRALSASHEQIVSILRSRLGQNHGDLLAIPRVDASDGIQWTTNVVGAVLSADQLPDDERARLQQRAERISAEIRGLAQQLRGEGPAALMVAQMLEQALQTPPGQWLYSVGGKPVMAMWGHGAPGTVAPAVAAPGATATAASAAPVAGAAAGAAGTPPIVPPPPPVSPPPGDDKGWKRWLLWGLLALVLLALLLFGLKRCSDARQPDTGLADQIAQAEARNKTLEDEIARARAQKPTMQCVPDAPPPAASAPEPPASAPEPAASTPPPPEPPPSQPPPNPADALKKRIAASEHDCDAMQGMLKNEPLLKGNGAQASALKQQITRSMEKNCREKLIKEAKNLCPGQRPPEIAPEMAIVFDASGSMNFSLDVTEAQIRQSGQAAAVEGLMKQFGLGGLGAGGGALERLTREPKRITVAKRATAAIVQRVPSDMNIGLVMVDQCPAARPIGMFPPGQRGSLIGQIQGIQPRAGTPLADGIAKAGQMVDGVKREALIVVVSDGTESCGQDPCAVAAALKRAKPYVKINVVDITGTGAGNCVAQLTGGKVFTANNADELVAQTNRAAQDALGPANCKP